MQSTSSGLNSDFKNGKYTDSKRALPLLFNFQQFLAHFTYASIKPHYQIEHLSLSAWMGIDPVGQKAIIIRNHSCKALINLAILFATLKRTEAESDLRCKLYSPLCRGSSFTQIKFFVIVQKSGKTSLWSMQFFFRHSSVSGKAERLQKSYLDTDKITQRLINDDWPKQTTAFNRISVNLSKFHTSKRFGRNSL